MDKEDPVIINSPLNRNFSKDGVTVNVLIYRLADDKEWVLEVVDENGGSTVWTETFATDKLAYEEFLRTVEKEGTATFLSNDGTTLH